MNERKTIKVLKIIIVALIVILIALTSSFIAYVMMRKIDTVTPASPVYMYNVTFEDYKGGEKITQKVENDKPVSKPNDPIRDGYIFADWKNLETGEMWDFSESIKEDICLVGIWKARVNFYNETESAEDLYLDIYEGSYVSLPEPEVKEGYLFGGWYKDEEFTKEFNSDLEPISSSVTLYPHIIKETTAEFFNFKDDGNGGWEVSFNNQIDFDEDYLAVPSHFDFKPVTTIAENGLSSLAVKKIVLPNTVHTIKDNAISNNEMLTEIWLSKNLVILGNFTFQSCYNLKVINIHSGLKSIGDGVFGSCYNLRKIYIPETVEYIGNYALGYEPHMMGKIERIVYFEAPSLPSSWAENYLGYSYYKNTAIVWNCKNNYLADTLAFYTEVNGFFFEIVNEVCRVIAFPHYEHIEIPAYVEWKGNKYPVKKINFQGNYYTAQLVKSMTIPETVDEISSYSFINMYNLETIKFEKDSQLKKIEYSAFSNLSSLKEIVLPESLQMIDAYVFQSCPLLSSIIIPKSVKVIGEHAFGGMESLTVFAESEEIPSGWSENWASGAEEVNVIWGYKTK